MARMATSAGPRRKGPGQSGSDTKAKTTISISRDLLTYADLRAAREHVTRSQVIEEVLAEAMRREEDELAAEGYRFFNDENDEFARQVVPLFWEAVKDDR